MSKHVLVDMTGESCPLCQNERGKAVVVPFFGLQNDTSGAARGTPCARARQSGRGTRCHRW
jgi:hypothetical protein